MSSRVTLKDLPESSDTDRVLRCVIIEDKYDVIDGALFGRLRSSLRDFTWLWGVV